MDLAGSSDDEKGTDWRYALDVMSVVLLMDHQKMSQFWGEQIDDYVLC